MPPTTSRPDDESSKREAPGSPVHPGISTPSRRSLRAAVAATPPAAGDGAAAPAARAGDGATAPATVASGAAARARDGAKASASAGSAAAARAGEGVTPSAVVPDAPRRRREVRALMVQDAPDDGVVSTRKGRRASSDTISAPVGPGDAAESAAQAPHRPAGRRAGRLADETGVVSTDGAAPAAAAAAPPVQAAASTVAAPRPHLQRGGRRAAESFTDAIERPAGGRRARVAVPTTAEAATVAAAAPVVAREAGEIEIAIEIVPAGGAGAAEAAGAATTAGAAAAVAGADRVVAQPVPAARAVSRRTLRTTSFGAEASEPGSSAPDSSDASAPDASAAGPSRPNSTGRRSRRGDIAKGGLSALALIFATGIAVATTMPASAWHAASDTSSVAFLADVAPQAPGQQLTTSAEAAGSSIARDGFGVRDVAALKAAGLHIADTFTNNPNGAVQWPFPVGVPISDGFGARESPGGIGSTDHKGVDFAPGQGTAIQAVADGVVSLVQSTDNGGLGVYVIIDHVIDGQKVSSVYGHMLSGSIQLSEGQVVKVAQTVGRVGNTGTSTGPHLHLEIRLDGVTPVDPFAWLQTHAV
ncbi:M23 family metallopeptidase [Herbiconiux sp. 11R-BC]|uniref:M23 family metallopeptidase n=1 Tax=Herbiconiux sp. 11R-BC TaxID=3111637 RepID=UPI003BFBE583